MNNRIFEYLIYIFILVITNILSVVAALLFNNNIFLILVVAAVNLYCQITAYISSRKKKNLVFPIELVLKNPFVVYAVIAIIAIIKYQISDIEFNGNNFNDIVTLPFEILLMILFVKRKNKKYGIINNETRLNKMSDLICVTCMQFSLYYCLFFYRTTSKNPNPIVNSQFVHIVHLTILMYFITSLLLYILIFFRYISKKRNDKFFEIKDSFLFTLIYVFLSIWGFENHRLGYIKTEGIYLVSAICFLLIHIIMIVFTAKISGFLDRKALLFNVFNFIIFLIVLVFLYYDIIVHTVKNNVSACICGLIIIIVLIAIIISLLKRSEDDYIKENNKKENNETENNEKENNEKENNETENNETENNETENNEKENNETE